MAALLALASGVSAQMLPVPALPPEAPEAGPPVPNDDADATAGETRTGARPAPWQYGLGVGVGYDSNIDFVAPDGPSSVAISPRGSLDRVFWSPKGQLRVGGAGNWIGYPDQKDLNRYNADFSVDGSHGSSLSTWRFNASYGLGHSDSSSILVAQGVLLPVVRTRTTAAGLGFTRKLGTRISLRLDGRFYRTLFEQQATDALGLVDGQSLRGTAGLERRFGVRDTGAIEYSLESALSRQPQDAASGEGRPYYLTHFASLQWTHLMSPRDGLLLEAGASYTPQPELALLDRPASFYGGITYRRQVKRSSLVLFVRREVIPAFGLGVSRVENRLGLSATMAMGRPWRVQVTGTHSIPETPQGADFAYGTPDEASVILARRLGRSLEVSGEGRYRRRSAAGSFPAIEAYQAGVFLSLFSPDRSAAALPRPPSAR